MPPACRPEDSPELMPVARIVGAFGLKGHLKLDPLTDFWQRFDRGSKLSLKGQWLEVEDLRIQKNRPLLKLRGIETATQAEALQWETLYGDADVEIQLEDDEFLADELEGLTVVTEDGEELGEVDEILSYPAQDILQVGEILIPLVKEFIVDIDLDEERITVRLIPGMRGEEV